MRSYKLRHNVEQSQLFADFEQQVLDFRFVIYDFSTVGTENIDIKRYGIRYVSSLKSHASSFMSQVSSLQSHASCFMSQVSSFMAYVSSLKSYVLSFKGNVDETIPYVFVSGAHTDFISRMFYVPRLMHHVARDMFDTPRVFMPAK